MREHEIDLKNRYILIGLNVKYYRNLSGLTQLELAEQAGLSRGVISHLEAPDMFHAPTIQTLFKIADALKIPTFQLVQFKDVDYN